jgi:hypothetical protein
MNNKNLPVLFLMVGVSSSAYQADPGTKRLETELVQRLKWESLWADSGVNLRSTPNGSATLSIYVTGSSLSFCSHDLGICESYQKTGLQLGQSVKAVKCDEASPCGGANGADDKALRAFVQQSPIPSRSNTAKRIFNTETPHGLAGAMTWSTTVHLGFPTQIVGAYRTSRPAQMDALRSWLLESHKGSGYASITVACFLPSDPLVFLYGNRPGKGPIIFEAYWNTETEQWKEAGFLDRPEDRKQIEQLKAKIELLSCAKVNFK